MSFQSVESIGIMEFGLGADVSEPAALSPLRQAMLKYQSAYQSAQGAQPGMSAGSASVYRPAPLTSSQLNSGAMSPSRGMLPRLQGPGMTDTGMGLRMGTGLPRLEQPGQAPGTGGFGWGRPGQGYDDWLARSEESNRASAYQMARAQQMVGAVSPGSVLVGGSMASPNQLMSPRMSGLGDGDSPMKWPLIGGVVLGLILIAFKG
jgi:hypothetical protein